MDTEISAERQAERERQIQQLLPPAVRDVYDLMVATEKGGYNPQEMWNVIEGRKMPANIRSDLRTRVLAEVSRRDGCDAAVDFLNSRVGPGYDRKVLLVGAFGSAVLHPASAISALEKLEFPEDELERAYGAIGESFKKSRGGGEELIKLLPGNALRYCVGSVVTEAFSLQAEDGPVRDQARAQEVLNRFLRPDLGDDDRKAVEGHFFAALASDRPATAWAMLKDGSWENSVMRQNVSRALMGSTSGSPVDALSEACQYKGAYRDELIQDVAVRTAIKDMNALEKVITTLGSSLDPAASDQVALGIAKHAATVGEWGTAKQWVETIRGDAARIAGDNLVKGR